MTVLNLADYRFGRLGLKRPDAGPNQLGIAAPSTADALEAQRRLFLLKLLLILEAEWRRQGMPPSSVAIAGDFSLPLEIS